MNFLIFSRDLPTKNYTAVTSSSTAANAFDRNFSTAWSNPVNFHSGNQWLKVDLESSKSISRFDFQTKDSLWISGTKSCTLQGSNDDSIYTTVNTLTLKPTKDLQTFNFALTAPYRYYKFNFTIENSRAFGYVNTFDIGIDIVNKILISSGDGEYKSIVKGGWVDLIPKMTSDTTPSGVASASSNGGTSYLPYKAFDKLATTTSESYITANNSVGWLSYNFQEEVAVKKYTITSATSSWEILSPKAWTFEGSNDGNVWTILDTQINIVGYKAGIAKEFIIANSSKFKIYRINFTQNVNGSSQLAIGELGMFDFIPPVVKVLRDTSELNFINHGMDKPIELDMTTVLTQKEIINTDGTSTIIDVEPFTLADEFKGKEIKILEYTDNPSQVESKVETEVCPYTIYDEFGDTMEVLYYTDDATKDEASLEITANYSPLDEFYDQPMSLVTYTNDASPVKVTVEGIAPSQWIYQTNDIDIRQGLEEVKLYGSEAGKGISRVLVSPDKGATWFTIKDAAFTQVDPLGHLNRCDLATYESYNQVDASVWKSFFQNKETLRVAYFLSENNTEDVAIADKIEIKLAAVSIDTPTIESIQFEISELTLEGRLKDLELINAINMQKLQFKTNSLMQSKKYKMHDLVVDTFEGDSMITTESASNEIATKAFTTPISMEDGFCSEVSLEEFKIFKKVETK